MTPAPISLPDYDWDLAAQDLDAEGWALLPGFFPEDAARRLARTGATPAEFEPLRAALYRQCLPIARRWAAALQQGEQDPDSPYPDDLAAWTRRNREAGQTRGLSGLHRLGAGGYQPLIQHADGAHVFPLQLVALLSEPGVDFTGGEFIMTEQRPRMQSRPMVLPLGLGDAAVIAVWHRPVHGARDIYRVTARQAVSRVRSGDRTGLQVLLHDGP